MSEWFGFPEGYGFPEWVRSPRCETCTHWTHAPNEYDALVGTCYRMQAYVGGRIKQVEVGHTRWCGDYEPAGWWRAYQVIREIVET